MLDLFNLWTSLLESRYFFNISGDFWLYIINGIVLIARLLFWYLPVFIFDAFRYNLEEIFIDSCHNIYGHSICSALWTCYNHELSSWNFYRFHFNAPGKHIWTISLVTQFNLTGYILSNIVLSHLYIVLFTTCQSERRATTEWEPRTSQCKGYSQVSVTIHTYLSFTTKSRVTDTSAVFTPFNFFSFSVISSGLMTHSSTWPQEQMKRWRINLLSQFLFLYQLKSTLTFTVFLSLSVQASHRGESDDRTPLLPRWKFLKSR